VVITCVPLPSKFMNEISSPVGCRVEIATRRPSLLIATCFTN
jgi:hypothetical protein